MIKSIARWSVENRVTVNMFMVILLVAGALSLFNIRREAFPQFALDMISISVVYPGASPEEIEEGICVKIEEAIKSVEGVKKIYSSASESFGTVVAELDANVSNNQKVLDDIETEVDRIDTFPDEAEDAVVREITFRDPVIYVAIYGDASEITLRKIAENVRDDLTNMPEITQATLSGARDYEISIELSEASLRQYGLSFDEVVRAVRSSSLDLPGGKIKTAYGDLSLRAKGQRYSGEEFESIPIRTLPDGAILTLGQVAKIIDDFEDTDKYIRFNQKPAVVVQILKTEKQDLLKIARAVHTYVKEQKHSLPSGIYMEVFFDQSEMVKSRIDLLLRNGRQGLILVFLTLALFLQFRLSFWVTMGIPVSLMGALWVLTTNGDSLNMISLFAFIMVLGMVVDDAIIIGENIYTKYSEGLSPCKAAVEGTAQVGWPVINTIMTTIAAFMPLFFVSGIMGKFIAVMPLAIISTLLFSMFEALFILPAHLCHSLEKREIRKRKNGTHGKKHRFREFIERCLRTFIDNYYSPILQKVLQFRYISLSIAIFILIIAVGLVFSGRVPYVIFSTPDSDWIMAKVVFPYGTSITSTEDAIHRIEKAAYSLESHYADQLESDNGKSFIRYMYTIVGEILPEGFMAGDSGGHCGEIILELMPSEERNIHYTDIVKKWRELTGEISGTEELMFTSPFMGPGGNPIEIKLMGSDFDLLQAAAADLKAEIAKYPGTFDINDDFRPGKPEVKIRTKPNAKNLGVSLSDLARQVRQGFYGEEALRIQRGRDDVKVMVRYTQDERQNYGSIDRIRVRTASGNEIPFSYVADLDYGRGYSTINRIDRQRTITITSDLDESAGNAKRIINDLKKHYLPDIETKYQGVTYTFGGQEETNREATSSLTRGYILALLAIFCLLATQFRSYIQPLIVMIAIPFGLIGALLGHLIMGLDLTLMSLFGIVALSGIVVNDSLVLIDFINQERRNNIPIFEAALESGKRRFRAVMLTTITTVAGLLPLLMERSFQAQFLIPMVISITFGLLFATLLTLLLVPALYLILHDVIKK